MLESPMVIIVVIVTVEPTCFFKALFSIPHPSRKDFRGTVTPPTHTPSYNQGFHLVWHPVHICSETCSTREQRAA